MSALVLPVLGVAAATGVLWMALSALLGRAGVDHAPYTVLRTHPGFELRRYEPSVLASYVTTGPDVMAAANKGFRPLAGYIFGGNSKRATGGGAEKIAMTSPVTMAPQAAGPAERIAMTSPVTMAPQAAGPAERIAMTSPVTMAPAGSTAASSSSPSFTVSFVMPSKYRSLGDLPTPHDPAVTLEEVPARYEVVAAHGGRGFPRGDEYVALSAQLRSAAEDAGYAIVSPPPGSPAKGYAYDPPWTPWFLKRNELAYVVSGPLPEAAPSAGGEPAAAPAPAQ
jgi:hypothetical protein